MIYNQLVDQIREESCLWSLRTKPRAEEQEDAWRRIALKNKMTSFEVKLIFRELTKKYKEERKKPKSTWKLLSSLSFLDEDIQPEKFKPSLDQKSVENSSTPSQISKDLPPQDIPQIKEEPHEKLPYSQNTSDEDLYVELLEVGDEEDYSEDDEMDQRSPISNENTNAKTKPLAQPTAFNHNRNLTVLKPAMLNQSLLKNYSTACTTPTTSIKNSLPTSLTAKKTPLMFPGMKRKFSNEADVKSNGSECLNPPEKQTKILGQENMETTKSVTPTNLTKLSLPMNSIQKDTIQPAGATPPPQEHNSFPDTNANPANTVGIDGKFMNNGDVMPLQDLQNIKVEMSEDQFMGEDKPISNYEDASTQLSRPLSCMNDTAALKTIQSTQHSRMFDSLGQYVSNTLNTLPANLANKLEIKILEAIIAINTEKSNTV